jgi:hypothetical protein
LLRTCHQLRAETLEREAKVQDRIPYVLDLLLLNEKTIWVKWLSMPLRRTKMIDHLQINVRAFACHRNPQEESYGPRAKRLCAVLDGFFRRTVSRGVSGPVLGGRIKDTVVRANQGKIPSILGSVERSIITVQRPIWRLPSLLAPRDYYPA